MKPFFRLAVTGRSFPWTIWPLDDGLLAGSTDLSGRARVAAKPPLVVVRAWKPNGARRTANLGSHVARWALIPGARGRAAAARDPGERGQPGLDPDPCHGDRRGVHRGADAFEQKGSTVTPMGRIRAPGDVAVAALFLALHAIFTTGTELPSRVGWPSSSKRRAPRAHAAGASRERGDDGLREDSTLPSPFG